MPTSYVQLYNKFMVRLERELSISRHTNTVSKIMQQILRLRPLVTYNGDITCRKRFSDFEWLRDTKAIEKRAMAISGTDETLCAYYNSIINVLNQSEQYKQTYDEYIVIRNEVQKRINTFRLSHSKSKRQAESSTTREEIERVRTKLETTANILKTKHTLSGKEFVEIQNHMIVCLYTMIPPLRQDFVKMDVVRCIEDTDTSSNFFVVGTKQIILNDYKTYSFYGQKIMDVPEDLVEVIMSTLRYRTDFNLKRFPLLVNTKGKRLCASLLVSNLKKCFGHPMGPTAFRIFHNTETFGGLVKALIDPERAKIASSMCHNTSEQLAYVRF